jgi:2,5-diketo-D-gluconate reductase B
MSYVDAERARVPALGFGTFRMVGEECSRAVAGAIAVGYRHLDTAEIYENEEAVAAGVREAGVARSDLFITTKAWMDDLSPSGVRKSLEGSLRRLETDYVDLWLIHWPNPAFPLRETLEAMARIVGEGVVRHVGVSNFPAAMFEEAARIAPVVCNQVEYHPYLSQVKVVAAARAHRAFVTAFAPIAMGKVVGDATLREIGARYGKTAAQAALRWLVQQPGVVAIPKSSDPGRRAENIDVFDFSLTPAEMTRIHALARGERLIDPEFGPEWDVET